jgi:hypothetical protein
VLRITSVSETPGRLMVWQKNVSPGSRMKFNLNLVDCRISRFDGLRSVMEISEWL